MTVILHRCLVVSERLSVKGARRADPYFYDSVGSNLTGSPSCSEFVTLHTHYSSVSVRLPLT